MQSLIPEEAGKGPHGCLHHLMQMEHYCSYHWQVELRAGFEQWKHCAAAAAVRPQMESSGGVYLLQTAACKEDEHLLKLANTKNIK